MRSPAAALRSVLGEAVRTKVAGADHARRAEQIWGAPGTRWFAPGEAIWVVNRDAAMYPGGICALLLQSLHPGAMAGVADHSGFRGDPWGRLHRIAQYIAATTYAPEPLAQHTVDVVRAVHRHVRGVRPDGVPYAADDPDLLRWVHVAQTWSFLTAYLAWGQGPLSPAERDAYVRQTNRVATRLGATDLPDSYAALREQLEAYRPTLAATAAARDTADFLLRHPPLPWYARPAYRLIAAGGVALLPPWARESLGLHRSRLRLALDRAAGRTATAGLRWLLLTPEVSTASTG